MFTLALYLVTLLILNSYGEAQIVQPGPHIINVKDGKEAVLDCVVANVGEGKVVWMKGEEMVSMAGLQLMFDTNIETNTVNTDQGTDYQLKINKFSKDYIDEYFCILDRGEKDWDDKQKAVFTTKMEALVEKLPPKVTTSSALSFGEGSRAELKCTVVNYEGHSIMWLKGPRIASVSSELLSIGEKIYTTEKSRYEVKVARVNNTTQTVTLVIKSIKAAEDARKYACTAQVVGMKFNDYPKSQVQVVVRKEEVVVPTPKPNTCYWKAFENSRLPGVTSSQYTKRMGPSSMLVCMGLCRKSPGCKSVSYNSRIFTCYIMKVSSGGDMSKIGPLKDYLYAELFC